MKPDATPFPLEPLTALSSIDGRYRDAVAPLVEHLSEYALIKNRVKVECEYLVALSRQKGSGTRSFTDAEIALIREIENVSLQDAQLVKRIEKEGYGDIPATNHDVKAVEYFIKDKLRGTSLEDVSERVHFALTSEDTNSIAYGLMLRDCLEEVVLDATNNVLLGLESLAKTHAATPLLARTHGQPASPTTFGKEMRVFVERLRRQIQQVEKNPILVKLGGATGNFNAHLAAMPDIDWREFSRDFITGLSRDTDVDHAIALELNEFTTQIEPHDTYAELCDSMRRINTILIDCSQDMWRYISDGLVVQRPKAGEVGSSTMPHKVNPIDFENAEGNFGVANALFEHFARKLPISRLQRDLSDSTVLRVFGTAFGHSMIGYKSLLRGLGKISVNADAMKEDLAAHPEVLAEAIQTVLRHYGIQNAYERLKDLTRGRAVTMEIITDFIQSLPLEDDVKRRLQEMTPESYIGLSAEIARK
ncbi:MAG: adenylosuccinate lyase [Candidatus Parcubacteria bacterium]|jgi:adenylosuccinate lyase